MNLTGTLLESKRPRTKVVLSLLIKSVYLKTKNGTLSLCQSDETPNLPLGNVTEREVELMKTKTGRNPRTLKKSQSFTHFVLIRVCRVVQSLFYAKKERLINSA